MQISETFVGFVSESRRNRISGALWGTREVGGVALGGWWDWAGDGGTGMAGLGGGGETGGGWWDWRGW